MVEMVSERQIARTELIQPVNARAAGNYASGKRADASGRGSSGEAKPTLAARFAAHRSSLLMGAAIAGCSVVFLFSAAYCIHPYTAEDVSNAASAAAQTAVSAYDRTIGAAFTAAGTAVADAGHRTAEAFGTLKSMFDEDYARWQEERHEELLAKQRQDSAGLVESQEAMAETKAQQEIERAAKNAAHPFTGRMPYVANDYNRILHTSMGEMLYFSQDDSHWADYLYGGTDPMHSYGCGPTVVAMLADSFGADQVPVSPTDVADWASDNGYYSEGHGSFHELIPDGLKNYGLNCAPVTDITERHIRDLLNSDHQIVVLMGEGTFTKGGHFMILTGLDDMGRVTIADPNNMVNTLHPWNLTSILDELMEPSDSDESGAPVWSVSKP